MALHKIGENIYCMEKQVIEICSVFTHLATNSMYPVIINYLTDILSSIYRTSTARDAGSVYCIMYVYTVRSDPLSSQSLLQMYFCHSVTLLFTLLIGQKVGKTFPTFI